MLAGGRLDGKIGVRTLAAGSIEFHVVLRRTMDVHGRNQELCLLSEPRARDGELLRRHPLRSPPQRQGEGIFIDLGLLAERRFRISVLVLMLISCVLFGILLIEIGRASCRERV